MFTPFFARMTSVGRASSFRGILRLAIITTLGALGLTLTLAACGGDDKPAASEGSFFTAAAAERLADVRPVTPGLLSWPEEPQPELSSSETPEELAARDPIYAEYRRRTAHLEDDDSSFGNRWKDDHKLANLAVGVLASAADAHVVFLASNDLSLAYGHKYGFVVKAEAVEDLGDEAWRLWAGGLGKQVTYHWRRKNLWVEVHVDCFGDHCPSNVDAATRAWADAIDEAARAGS